MGRGSWALESLEKISQSLGLYPADITAAFAPCIPMAEPPQAQGDEELAGGCAAKMRQLLQQGNSHPAPPQASPSLPQPSVLPCNFCLLVQW